MRLPTPSGPAKMRLWGSVPRIDARAISSSRCRCPVMLRNGMRRTNESYHVRSCPAGGNFLVYGDAVLQILRSV